MTNNTPRTLTLRSFDVPAIQRLGIGYDQVLDTLMKISDRQSHNNYPPYNLIKISDDMFDIQLAVAGFTENELEVSVTNGLLSVSGNHVDLDDTEYMHRGIAARPFVREWPLAEHVSVEGVTASNGILSIRLVRSIPEEKKPKKFAITYKG
tara:strand:+ start:1665 stop:2117 length:453 start_codon:yes stop_codon:yes gene_type:complete